MKFPGLLMVRQNLPNRALADVAAETRAQMESMNPASRLKSGDTVAIGAGSRGIRNIDVILREVVRYWKEHGMRPFIFPAMGSHGAATAEGQADVLAHYGVTERAMGCPVISQLEVVSLGQTADGVETFMDREAYEAGGVMLVNRVKWHTDFEGKIESGLFKMMAIGLGKFAGAQRYHTFAYRIGMEAVVRTVGRQVLTSGRMLGGLAILEDVYHHTAKLEAVPVDGMEHREEELLALAKSWAGRIPVESLDVLIVDEMGKEISGTGMDTKVINRSIHAEYNPYPGAPRVGRVFVRDLSELTYNNAVGIGMADMATDRLVNRIDWTPTLVNAMTSGKPEGIRTPIHFRTDRECLERLGGTVGKFDVAEVTLGWIRNTMELSVLGLSENLEAEIRRNPNLEILGPARDLEFNEDGDLVNLLSGADTAIAG
jgi:hypothetical protein